MKTLILFSTRDGQTREIASFLASELKEQGIDSDTVDLNRTNEVEWPLYDRVVIGASIRYGHLHNKTDHKAIVPAIAWIAERTGKHCAMLGLPGRVEQKLARVAISLRRSFFWLTRHEVDREKSSRQRL